VNVKWGGDKRGMIKMRDKGVCKILTILIMLMVASGIAVGAGPANNDSNRSSVNVFDFMREAISLSSPPLPDLVVKNIRIYPNPPIAGELTELEIIIKNQGNGNAIGPIRYEVTLPDNVFITNHYDEPVDLPAGASFTCWKRVTWPPDTYPHAIRCIVDPDNTISESNEGNNRLTKLFRAMKNPPGNQPPILSNGYVTPTSGNSSTTFNYYVTYKDPDGDVPTVHSLAICEAPPEDITMDELDIFVV
jgi:hypothetical protein